MSSDYSSDDENRTNIFEPTLDNFEHIQHYIGKPGLVLKTDQEDCDLIENPLYSSKIEPNETENNCASDSGLVMEKVDNVDSKKTSKTPISTKKNPFDTQLLDSETSSVRSRTPEIQVDSAEAGFSKPTPPNSLFLSQKLSHSSSDLTIDSQSLPIEGVNFHVRSNSQHEITLNIGQSHSESALRQLKNIASPVGSATKEMVLSPLTKLAKGVQTLGANLDPRKMKVSFSLVMGFYLQE